MVLPHGECCLEWPSSPIWLSFPMAGVGLGNSWAVCFLKGKCTLDLSKRANATPALPPELLKPLFLDGAH